jgi:hypothetical protein
MPTALLCVEGTALVGPVAHNCWPFWRDAPAHFVDQLTTRPAFTPTV